ncbi:ECF-type riboflavin transporter substrate-binding protein [Heyndrickxia camelliae]|uniref:UPF0397 protein CWO92_21500 n=1 Tax=Heyndrickxia camelliae TaxID=1707093 RepID=A0A2N3LEJ1_9BACI|nr:ECF-type riboflavin transporter substrate-binding protein [Heyndrickxia camelliae]PKR82995.1 ECF transporter S component [Heyndrickxia camelliae]
MNRKGLSVKTIVAIGIGAAVFVILNNYVSIPSPIPNTKIQTSYGFLALMAVVFGPIAGGLIGLIGHALSDTTSYGSVWWSWVVVSVFVGFFIGLVSKKINIESGIFGVRQIVTFNLVQFIVQAAGWFLIAPTLDILIYAEPSNKVFVQGLFAGIANIISVAIIGTILLIAYARTRGKTGSLTKDM